MTVILIMNVFLGVVGSFYLRLSSINLESNPIGVEHEERKPGNPIESGHKEEKPHWLLTVSYTHLTLPTKRIV